MTTTPQKQNIVTWAFDIWKHVLANRTSSIMIILTGLYMIYGVLFMNWNVFAIMFVYWFENVIIGIFIIVKMLFVKYEDIGQKLITAAFFCASYGFFCAVHGTFVFSLFSNGFYNEFEGADYILFHIYGNHIFWHKLFQILPGIGLTMIFVFINHVINLAVFYFKKPVNPYVDSMDYMFGTENNDNHKINLDNPTFGPFKRIFILHSSLMFCGWIILFSGSTKSALCLLILLKIIIEFSSTINEKRKKELSTDLLKKRDIVTERKVERKKANRYSRY